MDIDGAIIVREAVMGDLPRIRLLHEQLHPEHGPTDERIAAGSVAGDRRDPRPVGDPITMDDGRVGHCEGWPSTVPAG